MDALTCSHAPSPNPRVDGCVKCGREFDNELRPRNIPLEREITAKAAAIRSSESRGVLDPTSLDNFADDRALPGGVRPWLDLDKESREEIADLRNYLVWAITPIWPAYLAGDRDAAAAVVRRFTALALVIEAWHVLNS